MAQSPAYKAAWRERNREKIREQNRAWREANPERLKEIKRASHLRNRDAALARSKAYREKNKEIIDAKRKIYNAEHSERLKAVARERRIGREDFINERAKRYRRNKKAQYLAYEIQGRARKRGLECDIDVEWVSERLTAGVCEMTGLPFDAAPRSAMSASVDRIDPVGGYTKANCRMIAWSLNRAMSNYGEDFIIGMVKLVLQRRGEL